MDIVLAKLLPPGIVFLDEAIDSVRLANFFLEQEEPPPVLQRLAQSVPWTARPSSDEELASPPYQFFFREQEEPQPGWPRIQTIQWLARPYSDEELASPPYKYFFLEQEDAWIGRTTAIIWTARPTLDDELFFTTTILDDEQLFVAASQALPWLARPFADEELASPPYEYFFLEQEDAWPALVEKVTWTARPASDDELIFTSTIVDDEQPFVVAVSAMPWLARSALDDEISTNLANFFIDQEEPWIARVTSIVWVARPALDDDLYPTVTAINVDEEQLPFTATQTIPWLVRPALDDEITGTGLANFFIDQEDPWIARATTVVWTLRPQFDDETIITATILDDEQPFVAALQTIPWLARSVLDDEISTHLAYFFLEQEEYWVAQTETVPWVPRPYPYDEISTSLANFGREQEEPGWPIPAVLARPWIARPFADDEIDFFVAGRLIIVELTVVDNADGTGALATISGSDIASSNTILVQPYSSTNSWTPGAVRTGDGTATLGTLGYQWAVVVGTSGNDLVLSNMVPFAATTSTLAVKSRLQNAVVARIQQLVMAQNLNANVYGFIAEDLRTIIFPAILVTWADISDSDDGGLNDLDDIGYSFRVRIVDRNSENYQAPRDKYLLWRQQLMRALRNQRQTGVLEWINTKVKLGKTGTYMGANYQYFCADLIVECVSREVRGLT